MKCKLELKKIAILPLHLSNCSNIHFWRKCLEFYSHIQLHEFSETELRHEEEVKCFVIFIVKEEKKALRYIYI